MKKRSTIIILLLAFIILPLKPKAAVTFGEELDYLDQLKAEKAAKQYEKELTEAEYKQKENEIIAIENEITKLSDEIVKATREIEELEKKIEEKKEETNSILVFLQLSSGEKSYLEYIFKATSFTDFIHRVSIVEQLSKYNKEQIAEMNDLIKKNNELKKQNAENIEKQKTKKQESQAKMAELGSKISKLVEEESPIEKKIEDQESLIASLRKAGCSDRDDLISVCAGYLTDTGFLRPIEYGVVTSEYEWRFHPTLNYWRLHSGIDLGVSEGTPVYPVANGTIIGKIYRASCGGNQLYVSHIINGEMYTSVYMHLLNFNENYQIGDIVTSSTVIAWSGGGASSWYDYCTTGAHLHLTLSYGHTLSLNNTFNPKEKIDFPAENYWFYGRSW